MDALLSMEKVSSQSQLKAEIAQDTKEYLKIMHSILREEWQSTPASEADKTVSDRDLISICNLYLSVDAVYIGYLEVSTGNPGQSSRLPFLRIQQSIAVALCS